MLHASTDFLIVPTLKALQLHIATASTLDSIYIEAFEKLLIVSLYQQLHSRVLLILGPPALIFSYFQHENQDISLLLWPYNQLTHSWLSAFHSTAVAS